MSSAKFHNVDHERPRITTRVINGRRPSPLKINKDSRGIHKPYSSSASSNSKSSFSGYISGLAPQQQQKQQRQPVIIYAHSPKVIHTQPRNFMALVQKLTGLSRSSDHDDGDHKTAAPKSQAAAKGTVKNNKPVEVVVVHEDNDSSSVLTEDQKRYGGRGDDNGDVGVNLSSVSPITKPPTNPLADIPLFTPTSNDFFCSPKPVYRFPDSIFASPNTGNSISPSVTSSLKDSQNENHLGF